MACASNEEKDILARSIVQVISSRNGRFLQKVESSEQFVALGIPKSVKVAFVLATEEIVLTKTKQCIRDIFKRSMAVEATKSPAPKKGRREKAGAQQAQQEDTKIPPTSTDTLMQNQDVDSAEEHALHSNLHRHQTYPQFSSFAGVDSDGYRLSALTLPPGEQQSQSWLRQGMITGNETLQQEQLQRSGGLPSPMPSALFPQHTRELASRGSLPAVATEQAWQHAAASALTTTTHASPSSSSSDSLLPALNNPLLSMMNENERVQLLGEILRRLGSTNDASTSLSSQQSSSTDRADFDAGMRNAAVVSMIRRQYIASQQQNGSNSALQRLQQSHLPISYPAVDAQRLLQHYLDGMLSNVASQPQQNQSPPLPFHQWTPQQQINLLLQRHLQVPSSQQRPVPLQQALQAHAHDRQRLEAAQLVSSQHQLQHMSQAQGTDHQQRLEAAQQLARLLQQVGRSGNSDSFQTILPQALSLTSSAAAATAAAATPTTRAEAKGRDSSPEDERDP